MEEKRLIKIVKVLYKEYDREMEKKHSRCAERILQAIMEIRGVCYESQNSA